MRTFDYEITIKEENQSLADRKMQALVAILPKLTTEELEKMAKIVNDPIKLALIKTKL